MRLLCEIDAEGVEMHSPFTHSLTRLETVGSQSAACSLHHHFSSLVV